MRVRALISLLLAAGMVPAFGHMVRAEVPTGPLRSVLDAQYAEPTDRYPHPALGGGGHWAALALTIDPCPLCSGPGPGQEQHIFRLPEELIFEDTAPRLADLDADGVMEVIVVESHATRGSRLAVYDVSGRRAATDFIGTRFRWMAPIGAADLDGDGQIEIAYVETPHLGKVLKIVRLEGTDLAPVASVSGLTNHQYGDPAIQGQIAPCAGQPTIFTADADWQNVMATTLQGGKLITRRVGRYKGPKSLSCPD